MNNEIQQFDFKGASLRTLTDEEGEPGSCSKIGMSILDLGNPTETVKMFDKDESVLLKSSIRLVAGSRRISSASLVFTVL